MKKLTVTFILLFLGSISKAQEVNQIPIKEIPAKYIQIRLKPVLFGKRFAVVNYGQITNYTSGGNLKKLAGIKENDQLKEFNTEIEVLNYLADLNFKLIESYQNISSNLDNGVDTDTREYLLENLNR